MPLPDTSTVIEALNAGVVDEPQVAPAPAAPVQTPSGDEASKVVDGETPATPAPTDQAAPSDPVATYSALIKEKGAKAAFDLLPDDVKEQIAAEMYPGVHRAMSKKERDRVAARQELDGLKTDISKVVNDRFDELMTQGLTDDDKKAYFDRKRLAELDDLQKAGGKKPTPEETQAMEEAQQKMEYAWSLIEKAGLPRDPNDARVRTLDFAWDEADFGKAMQRLNASLRKAPASAEKPVGVATPAPSPSDEAVRKMAAEMAATTVREELKRLNLLQPDNGRPGAASGASKPRTMTDAVAEARRIIEQEVPGR